jgi:hypothetical protein
MSCRDARGAARTCDDEEEQCKKQDTVLCIASNDIRASLCLIWHLYPSFTNLAFTLFEKVHVAHSYDNDCTPQLFRTSTAVHAAFLEAVFVMQTAEDRRRGNTVAVWNRCPVDSLIGSFAGLSGIPGPKLAYGRPRL